MSHPPSFEQHRPRAEIGSLGVLQAAHGNVLTAEICRWWNEPAMAHVRARVAALVGKDPTPIEKQDISLQILAYYVYTRAQQGGANHQYLAVPAGNRPGPFRAVVPVYRGIFAEHQALGKNGDWLDRDAALDCSRFVIGASARSVNSEKQAREGQHPYEILPILRQFPCLEKASKPGHVTEHDLEHDVLNVAPEDLMRLIMYLRFLCTYERGINGRGLRHQDLPHANHVIELLEEILAKRMSKAMQEGDATKRVDKVCEVTQKMFHAPYAEVMNAYFRNHRDIEQAFGLLHGLLKQEHHEEKPLRVKVSDGLGTVAKLGERYHGLLTLGLLFEEVRETLAAFRGRRPAGETKAQKKEGTGGDHPEKH